MRATHTAGERARVRRRERRKGRACTRGRARPADPLVFRFAGMVIAASGLAHFAVPKVLGAIVRPFFPEETAKWVQINGALETVIGLAVANRHTRVLGGAGLIAYGIYLGDRIVAYAWRRIS